MLHPKEGPQAPHGPFEPPTYPVLRQRVADILGELSRGVVEESQGGFDARLVLTPDGRPIRSIRTGRRVIVTGSYSSRKAGRPQPWESPNEYLFYQQCEVDTQVVDYRAQPFRFEFSVEGIKRIYIPDCACLLADGALEVVEVKNEWRDVRDPFYALKLEAADTVCANLGWRLRLVFKDELTQPPERRANIRLIQSKRTVAFNAVDVYVALQALEAAGGSACLGSIATALGDPRLGRAKIMAMMVGRVLHLDLDHRLSDHTTVTAVAPATSAKPKGLV